MGRCICYFIPVCNLVCKSVLGDRWAFGLRQQLAYAQGYLCRAACSAHPLLDASSKLEII